MWELYGAEEAETIKLQRAPVPQNPRTEEFVTRDSNKFTPLTPQTLKLSLRHRCIWGHTGVHALTKSSKKFSTGVLSPPHSTDRTWETHSSSLGLIVSGLNLMLSIKVQSLQRVYEADI